MTEKDKSSCESLLKNSLFSSNMLLNLINDLLDLAKMENSQFHLNIDLFNLHDVINKALDTLAFQAQQKNIKLSYVYEDSNFSYFTSINGDSYRYQQILLNFLSNALKFTPFNGLIKVEVRLLETQSIASESVDADSSKEKGEADEILVEEVEDDNKRVPVLKDDTEEKKTGDEKYIKFELRIEDSGYGISPENIPKLFMNFGKLEEHAGGNK